MAFVEIKKKGKLTRYAVDVVYRINQTTKLGVLRFTKKGIDTLSTSFPQVTINKPFKIFIDKDNGELAFHNDPKGDFRITKSKKEQYAIFSTDLTKEIEKDSFYLLQHSKEYGFILVPVEDGKTKELPSPKPETTKPVATHIEDTSEQTTISNDSKADKASKTPKVSKASKASKATKDIQPKAESIEIEIETKPEVVAEPKEEPKEQPKVETKVEPAQTKVVEAVKEQPATDKVETKSTTTKPPKAYKVASKPEDKATSDKPKPKGRPKKNK